MVVSSLRDAVYVFRYIVILCCKNIPRMLPSSITSWFGNWSLQLWHINKQQLILIIKLVTSVFLFPCFNRKINQRVLFVFFRILYCKFCVQFFNKPIHNFKPIKFATSNNVLHFYRVLGKNQTQRWRHSPYSHSRVLRFLIGK